MALDWGFINIRGQATVYSLVLDWQLSNGFLVDGGCKVTNMDRWKEYGTN